MAMITFANISRLSIWLLASLGLATCVLAIWRERRSRLQLLRLFGDPDRGRVEISVDRRKRRWRGLLRFAALVCAWLALLRPQLGNRPRPSTHRPRDLALAIQVNPAAREQAPPRQPLAEARNLARQIVGSRTQDRFALVSFAGAAFLECPLTRDRAILHELIDDLSPESMPIPGANLSAALETAAAALAANPGGHRAIILIGDESLPESPPHYAAAPGNIPVFQVALTSRNQSFLAESAAGLQIRTADRRQALARLLPAIEALVPTEIETADRQPVERYQIPLAIAILCLLGSLSIDDRKNAMPRRRVRSVATVVLLLLSVASIAPAAPPTRNAPSSAETAEPEPVSSWARQDGIWRRELLQARSELNRATTPEASATLYYNIGRLHQFMDELPEAAHAYRMAIARFGADQELRARSLWNLAAVEHLQARQTFANDLERAAEQLAAAQKIYLEALKIVGDQPGLVRNYELLLREQQLLELFLTAQASGRDEREQENAFPASPSEGSTPPNRREVDTPPPEPPEDRAGEPGESPGDAPAAAADPEPEPEPGGDPEEFAEWPEELRDPGLSEEEQAAAAVRLMRQMEQDFRAFRRRQFLRQLDHDRQPSVRSVQE